MQQTYMKKIIFPNASNKKPKSEKNTSAANNGGKTNYKYDTNKF